MRTKNELFLLILLVALPFFTKAQGLPGIDQNAHKKTDAIYGSQKGKFHIALQNFGFGTILNQSTTSTIGFRAGYSISNKDMVFLNSQFTWNPREGYSRAFENSLFYRRYFLDGQFQPFMQFGIGLGYVDIAENNMNFKNKLFYGIVSGGTGVSFRYKRWGFELGIQSYFNRYSSGRFSIAPIVGISFSF